MADDPKPLIRVSFKQRTALPGCMVAAPGDVHDIPADNFSEDHHTLVAADTPLSDPKPWDFPNGAPSV